MRLIELGVCAFYYLISLIFVYLIFGVLLGYSSRKKKIPSVIYALLGVAATAAVNMFLPEEDAYAIVDFILFFMFLTAPYVLFVPRKKYVFFCFSGVVAIVIDYIRSFFMPLLVKFYSYRFEAEFSTLECLIGIILILIFGKKLSSKLPEDFIEEIHPAVYFAVYIAYLASFTSSMEGIAGIYNGAFAKIMNSVSSGLIIFAVIYLVFRYVNVSALQKESEMQHRMELAYYEEISRKNDDIRHFRHDYKNNILAIKSFVKDNNTGELNDFLDKMFEDLETTAIKFNTGNHMADAIISDKSAIAEKSGNTIEIEGKIPEKAISNNDICTVFSNVLDNAIRACEDNPGSVIKIKTSFQNFGGAITVSNPVKEKVPIKNNSIKTTKSDAFNHGLGISNVKKVASKYGGQVFLTCDDTTFTFKITFCF